MEHSTVSPIKDLNGNTVIIKPAINKLKTMGLDIFRLVEKKGTHISSTSIYVSEKLKKLIALNKIPDIEYATMKEINNKIGEKNAN